MRVLVFDLGAFVDAIADDPCNIVVGTEQEHLFFLVERQFEVGEEVGYFLTPVHTERVEEITFFPMADGEMFIENAFAEEASVFGGARERVVGCEGTQLCSDGRERGGGRMEWGDEQAVPIFQEGELFGVEAFSCFFGKGREYGLDVGKSVGVEQFEEDGLGIGIPEEGRDMYFGFVSLC